MFDKLQKRLRPYAIPNITLYIVMGQAFFFIAGTVNPDMGMLEAMSLSAPLVLQGQVWRLATFVFVPFTMSPIWIIFALYLFYLMGSALESHWGTLHYNLYLLLGYLGVVAVAFLHPGMPVSNIYVKTSVFLAFAWLYPDFPLYIFFILPVRIKWLALVTWILYGWAFLAGPLSTRLLIGASVVNFLVFFGRDVVRRLRGAARRAQAQAASTAKREAPMHTCRICGATERSHPTMDFRYCTKCTGGVCYCEEHIREHEHI